MITECLSYVTPVQFMGIGTSLSGLMLMSSTAVVCCLPCLMSPRYSSLVCQWLELFSKLQAKALNTSSVSFWFSSDNWSFKAIHLLDASLPPKNKICVTLQVLVGSVGDDEVLLQSLLVEGPGNKLVLSIPVHVEAYLRVVGRHPSPLPLYTAERKYFTLGGCCGPKRNYFSLGGCAGLKEQSLPRAV